MLFCRPPTFFRLVYQITSSVVVFALEPYAVFRCIMPFSSSRFLFFFFAL